MNQFQVQHAFPGCCALCFTEVATFSGSDKNGKPIIKNYLGNYHPLRIGLDDGSQMTVTLCNGCAADMSKKDYKRLMESEVAGWKWELDNCLGKWSKEDKQEYKNSYFKKKIVGQARVNRRKLDVGH